MDERVLVVVGDVTGHGASSAIITGVAKASCDLALSVLGAQLTCENLLEMMNDAIWKAAREKVTMTCVASLIDAGQRRLNVASAGHPVPYCVRRREGDCDLRKVVTNGAPLGTASSAGLHTVSAPLEPGDLLLWYSDGLVDCENRAREMFSEKRLRAAIKDGYSLGAVGLRDRIVRDVQQFCGDERPIDDITLVVASVA
jgi:serine phosphatase RsbU (regulator of sigma subunit)